MMEQGKFLTFSVIHEIPTKKKKKKKLCLGRKFHYLFLLGIFLEINFVISFYHLIKLGFRFRLISKSFPLHPDSINQ